MGRRVGAGTPVRWTLRVEGPEGSHRRTEVVVRPWDRVGDEAGELGDLGQIECERRTPGEERPELFDLAGTEVRGRKPRVQQRQREGDVLRDPFRIQLAVRFRKRWVAAFEHERNHGLERSLGHAYLRAGISRSA